MLWHARAFAGRLADLITDGALADAGECLHLGTRTKKGLGAQPDSFPRRVSPAHDLPSEGQDMEKIDAKLLGMVSVTLLTRLTAHMERNAMLPLGWTAGELRQAAAAAENNILHGADPEFHHAFAKALCRIADLSLQSISEGDAEELAAPTLHSVGPEDEARGGHEAPADHAGPTVPGTGPKRS